MGLEAAELWALLSQYRYFIASVHPSIRRPESLPPQRGGHLVLTAADTQSVTFHNPSGDSPATRERVQLPLNRFTLSLPAAASHRIKKRAVSDESSASSAGPAYFHASRITQASACRS